MAWCYDTAEITVTPVIGGITITDRKAYFDFRFRLTNQNTTAAIETKPKKRATRIDAELPGLTVGTSIVNALLRNNPVDIKTRWSVGIIFVCRVSLAYWRQPIVPIRVTFDETRERENFCFLKASSR